MLSLLSPACLMLLATVVIPAPAAEARNRTNEDLRQAIFCGFSDATPEGQVARCQLAWITDQDREIAPGVYIAAVPICNDPPRTSTFAP